jgi:hypothetical protein
VYVVSEENALYSFAPDQLRFSKIGKLDCPATMYGKPSSMAIDRSGTAWVSYSDGLLFKVSTRDATCQATTFAVYNQWGTAKFGMAFATDSTTSQAETLYLANKNRALGLGVADAATHFDDLARLDLATMKVSIIGDFSASLAGTGAELTGTGDGRLFGFFATLKPTATLALIDKSTGRTSGDKLLDALTAGAENAFAFSFWGGDFWFYSAAGVTAPSTVTRMRTSGDGSLSTVMADVGGFRIVGAGVSTCAPLTPPPPR